MKAEMNNIAVLIPHFNNPKGLANSLASIDEEHPIDVVIVDDGSDEKHICENEIKNSFNSGGTIFFLYF